MTRAVTKAQLRRVVDFYEARGRTVAATILRPDGSWEVRLTDGAGSPSPAENDAEWERALGKWRHSA